MMAQKSKFRVVFGYILRKRKCILDFNIDAFFVRGTLSYRVQRYRIQPEEEPSWQLIYVGQKTEYEAQGLVPEFILQNLVPSVSRYRCSYSVIPHLQKK